MYDKKDPTSPGMRCQFNYRYLLNASDLESTRNR